MAVCFDIFTSTWRPGERRTFTYCAVCEKRCRKYVYRNDYESPRACAVWLMAWTLAGRGIAANASHPKDVKPTQMLLKLVEGLLPQ